MDGATASGSGHYAVAALVGVLYLLAFTKRLILLGGIVASGFWCYFTMFLKRIHGLLKRHLLFPTRTTAFSAFPKIPVAAPVLGTAFPDCRRRLYEKLWRRCLFLAPEYLGNVNFVSTALVGMAIGVFIMCWNITTFILFSRHFTFLAATQYPFLKYCINNSLIPLSFFCFFTC
jgi:hypothetical protein